MRQHIHLFLMSKSVHNAGDSAGLGARLRGKILSVGVKETPTVSVRDLHVPVSYEGKLQTLPAGTSTATKKGLLHAHFGWGY